MTIWHELLPKHRAAVVDWRQRDAVRNYTDGIVEAEIADCLRFRFAERVEAAGVT